MTAPDINNGCTHVFAPFFDSGVSETYLLHSLQFAAYGLMHSCCFVHALDTAVDGHVALHTGDRILQDMATETQQQGTISHNYFVCYRLVAQHCCPLYMIQLQDCAHQLQQHSMHGIAAGPCSKLLLPLFCTDIQVH